MDEPIILSTRDGYDRWSEIYDTEGNPLISLEEPAVDRLLGEVRGLDVADIGCGTGRHAVRLAERGARVVGLDFSSGMLAQARAKAPGLDLRVHDLSQPLPLADASFDRVLCCLVMDHVADVLGLMKQLGRIRRPDGKLIVSIMHPAMMLRGIQARFRDPETGRETRPESVPNQISDYVTAALGAGLSIRHMSEHAFDAESAKAVPRAEKYIGWPMLLLFELG